jgi:hypothetical protein
MLRAACLFVCIFMCSLCYAYKAPAAAHKTVLTIDSSVVAQRHLDTAAINAFKKLPDFTYAENYTGPSLWSRFWTWFWGLFEIKDEKQAGTFMTWFLFFLKYLFIGAGIAAIIFLILKLSGIDMLNAFRRKPQTVLTYSESDENIHEIDFDADIEKAIAVHNYRYAVRLLYLRSLKQLSDNGLINWQPNKTNTNYINELANYEQREMFKHLTHQFEYIWYGDFMINGDMFKKINPLFNNFKGSAA